MRSCKPVAPNIRYLKFVLSRIYDVVFVVSGSVADSDSVGGESGFDEQEVSEMQNNVIKFVTRFIDKVSTCSTFT